MSLLQTYQAIAEQEWIDIPQGWLQGRTIYGGLVAGLMMQKAQHCIADPEKRLLSSSVTFVGQYSKVGHVLQLKFFGRVNQSLALRCVCGRMMPYKAF